MSECAGENCDCRKGSHLVTPTLQEARRPVVFKQREIPRPTGDTVKMSDRQYQVYSDGSYRRLR